MIARSIFKKASQILVSIINFGGILSSSDDTVQKALDTLDDHIHPGNGGDMLKFIYDTDNDGIVDKAETVDDGESGNASTATEVRDAVDKKHPQNTDTILRALGDLINQEQTNYSGSDFPVYLARRLAQTFVPNITTDLTKITLRGVRTSSGNGVIVEIRTVDGEGLPTETVLGSTIIPNSSFLDDYSEIAKLFETPIAVTEGIQYALVIRINSGGRYDFQSGDANFYANGTCFYDEGDEIWLDQEIDLYFKIWVYSDADLINNGVLKNNLLVNEDKKIGNLNPNNNISGIFTTTDGKTVTVENGQIISIE